MDFEIAAEIISHEIEKGGQVGKTNPLCLGFSPLGEFRHKIQNINHRHLVEVKICKILVKLCNGKFVSPDGIVL